MKKPCPILYENSQLSSQPVKQIVSIVERAVLLKTIMNQALTTHKLSEAQLLTIQKTEFGNTSAPFEELEAYRQLTLDLVDRGTIQVEV
jgi:hypothetical protein